MCMNIYHKKHIQNFSYTLAHHLNKKKKIFKFQIFSVISTKREDVPYTYRNKLMFYVNLLTNLIICTIMKLTVNLILMLSLIPDIRSILASMWPENCVTSFLERG